MCECVCHFDMVLVRCVWVVEKKGNRGAEDTEERVEQYCTALSWIGLNEM